MGIVNKGTTSITTYQNTILEGDIINGEIARLEDIARYAYVVKVNAITTTGKGTITRSTVNLTADATAGTGNLSRALDIVTAATAGSLSVVEVGDVLVIGGAAAGTVTAIIDNTNVRVNASGTIGANTWTYQKPAFKNVYPGATVISATGPTTMTVATKVSDFAVTTVSSGTVASGAFTSYLNLDSIAMYREDDSKGKIYGVAMDSFDLSEETSKVVQVKIHGGYDKTKTTTEDTSTAGSVTEAIHSKARDRGLYHTDIINFE